MDLLERDIQLGTLDGALKTAAAGHGRVALVSGEAGIGKTSVARAFVEQRGDVGRVLSRVDWASLAVDTVAIA